MTETGKRRPWYVAPLLAGFGGVLGVAVTLGLIDASGHGRPELKEAHASIAPPPDVETARWRERMEQKIDALTEKVAKIEGRLEQR